MEKNNIITALFVSEWDGGTQITTPCKVNLDTKEVFEVELADCGENVGTLDREFIVIDDWDYPVFQISDITEEDDEFWYEA